MVPLPLPEDRVDVELVVALLVVLVDPVLLEELPLPEPEPDEEFSLKTPPPITLGIVVLEFLAALR